MSGPVRKVTSNGRTIVGYMPSSKSEGLIQHESNLEKDFIYILKFDPHVISIQDQPVLISYLLKGKKRKYTPDFLVKYDNGNQVIFEVKYSANLEEFRKELKPKFLAGKAYAKENSIHFKIITELQIRTAYKKNLIYLDQFRTDAIDLTLTQRITVALELKKKCTGNELLESISSDESDYNQLIRPFWILVFHSRICCNLFEDVTLNSMFGPANIRQQKFLTYPYRNVKSKSKI